MDYVKRTNLSDYRSSCIFLVKAGHGSLAEVEALDSKEFLDCMEYEEIRIAIEINQQEES